MQSAKPKVSSLETVVAIVLPESRVAAVEELIDKYSAKNWRDGNRIYLIAVPDAHANDAGHIASVVRTQARLFGMQENRKNVRYLVFKELKYRLHAKIDWVASPDFISSVTYKHLADDLLEIRLREWGLHWRQLAVTELQKWQYDEIGEAQIEEWIEQFNVVSSGANRWVGEHLLREFRVWSPDEIASALRRTYQHAVPLKSATIIRYENGKSADAISMILKKKLLHTEIEEYCEKLEQGEPDEFDIFEDGLFTGIEISDYYSSLLGVEGFNKCAPLTDPSRLGRTKARIRFAVGTDMGLAKLKTRIAHLGISVDVLLGIEINVLTSEGAGSLRAGTLYTVDEQHKEILTDALKDVVPQAFVAESWGERRQQAIDFCRALGSQLWGSLLESKGKKWSPMRIADCALGSGNIALPFAFSHSVPKSALPVFWCHGSVKGARGKKFVWKPLFPSAHAL